MTTRLFCEHCDKFYEVDMKDIRFMQAQNKEYLNFAHNTYFFKNGCFFQELSKYKKKSIP